MYYQVCMYFCTVAYQFIALPFTSTLGGGGGKAYLIIAQPNLTHNLVLLGILDFTILTPCGGINPQQISSIDRVHPPPSPHDRS